MKNDIRTPRIDSINLGNGVEIGLFEISADASSAEIDIQLATAVLLFEVVKSDGHVDRVEVIRVIEILRERFSLSGEQVGRLLEMISDDGSQAPLQSLTDKIREHWGFAERLLLLENFWVIAIADKIIDERETKLINELARLLNLDDNEISAARQQARKRLESGAIK